MHAMTRSLTVLSRAKAVAAPTLLGVLILFGLSACDTFGGGPRTANSKLAFNIQPSRSSILTDENVTFTTYSSNLVGTKAHIRWTTTGGQLHTYRNGDTARIQFDKPGVYTVFADLFVDGTRMKTDQATIRVKPTHRGVSTTSNRNNGQGNNGAQGRNGMENQGSMQGQGNMQGQEMQGQDEMRDQGDVRGQGNAQGSNNMSNPSPQRPRLQTTPRSGNQNGMSSQSGQTPNGRQSDNASSNAGSTYK